MSKILFAALALTLAAQSQAQSQGSVAQPAAGAPACFKRVYTEAHMRQHPKQKLTELYVGIKADQWKGAAPDPGIPGAKVVGRSNGQYYVNNDAGCSYQKDGSTRCQIECDGGAFDLTPFKKNVIFSVAKKYYFPLYKNGFDAETASEQDRMSLDWTDRENRAYLLVPAPAAECEAAQKRAKIGDLDC